MSDLTDLHEVQSDPHVMRYMIAGVHSREQTRARLARFIEEQRSPGWTRWRLADEHDRLVGRAGLVPTREAEFRELGYMLAPALWGQGHATELARALVSWHNTHPAEGLDPRLRARVFPAHAASRRVLDRAGFELLGPDEHDTRLMTYQTRRPDTAD